MKTLRTVSLVVLVSACSALATTNHWAFQAVQRPAIPSTTHAARNPIDAFIFAKLEATGLSPSPEADRKTLIRRLFLDVLGLPPSWEEVQAFIADPRRDAYERLVERVLASPHYGERWARHWLDVVRFAETHGFETNTPRDNAWPYRDYVIRALNEDRPYPRFILEQLAGDAVGEDAATGFIVAGPWDEVKSPDVVLTSNQRADELHDMVATTGSAFLGLTVGCARCHDHKFDPVPQVDYYAMKACFAGVQHGQRKLRPRDHDDRVEKAQAVRKRLNGIESELTEFEPLAGGAAQRAPVHPKQNVERFHPVAAKFLRFTVLNTTGLEPCIDELEIYSTSGRNVALASAGAEATASSVYPNNPIHRLEHVNDGLYGNGRSWISRETSKGWVQIALPEQVTINKVVWGRDREEKYADRLATSYRIEVGMDTNNWKLVASSEDRKAYVAGQQFRPEYFTNSADAGRLQRLLTERGQGEDELKVLTTFPVIYAGNFTDPQPTHRLHRGDAMLKKEEVAPGALTEIGFERGRRFPAKEQERRMALARWIADENNPLTARVMVNRIWHYHFGQGLVNTPSDFGLKGSRPTHPELLDWLATEFIAGGWRPKAIHRRILLSHSYRQASAPRADAQNKDAHNSLLWRFAPRRLEAEPIRDSILAISGALDLRMGGPGYHVFEPNNNYVRVYDPKQQFGPAEWRRMIYQYKPRMQQDATFGAFDCPDGGQIAPARSRSTTALQALNLMNSPFMLQQAELFAQRIKREPSQIERAFQLALSRSPTREESEAAQKLIREHNLIAFCRALLNSNEFLYLF